jgi:lysophospholipase L1-like esterase
MNIFSLFSFTIFAAESIISPLTPDYLPPTAEPSKPAISFAELAIPEVLGVATEEEIVVEPSPTPTPSPIPIRHTKKSTVTIALLGDSMMDTLGPNAPHLASVLKKTYPNTTVVIKNVGVGGKPIDDGIERITNGYTYLGSSYPSLASLHPDVVVVESFGYNPTGNDQGAIDHHWLELARAIDSIRANLPDAKIVIAATIAPNASRFGDGAPGIAFSSEDKVQRTETIKKYIETAIKFAKSEHIPLADAYDASMDTSGNGKLVYINSGDHIHYSDAGRSLMGSKIAGAIVGNKLLE